MSKPLKMTEPGDKFGLSTVVSVSLPHATLRCVCGGTMTRRLASFVRKSHCGCLNEKNMRGLDYVITRPMMLREIAKVLGVTHERVRTIEKAALAKLRAALDAPEGIEVERGIPREEIDETAQGGYERTIYVDGVTDVDLRLSITRSTSRAYCAAVNRLYESRIGKKRKRGPATASERRWNMQSGRRAA